MKYYQDSSVTLYHGDCVEVMKKELIPNNIKVDKVITSPPYNIWKTNAEDRGYDLYKDNIPNEQYIEWTIDIFNCYDKLLNPNGCIAYNMSYGTGNPELMSLTIAEIIKRTNFTLADILIWKKLAAMPNHMSANKMTRICEFVYVFCRRNEYDTFTSNKQITSKSDTSNAVFYEVMYNFFVAANNSETQDLNKATFSVEFVNNIIDRYVLPTDVVLDNFNGTGTTLVACDGRGIKGIGIELSEAQCEYTVNRLKRGVQLSLF